MASESTLFDSVRNLYTKEVSFSTETKIESIYMINRFLSLSPQGFFAAVECNKMVGVPDWAKMGYLYYSIPKQPAPSIKYPKAEKEKLPPKRKRALSRVCSVFCVGEYHAHQIMALLEAQGVVLESD